MEQYPLTVRKTGLDNAIGMVVLILMAAGAVMTFSASANLKMELNLQNWYQYRHLIFFPLAAVVMYLVSLVPYRCLALRKGWLKSPTCYLFAFSMLLLVITLIPGFGTEVNYARRWLRVPAGPVTISFQPSELAKWSMVLLLAAVCDIFNDSLGLFWKRFIPLCGIVALTAGLIVVEDFGTAAFVSLLGFLIMFIAGVRWWHLLTPVPFAVGVFGLAIVTSPSRIARIGAFLQPEKFAASAGYQAQQSLIALASGGLWGKGLGYGISKYGHLPEDTTDFIFAIIGEELGFCGTAAVILLFAAFAWLGFIVVARCEDRFGQLLAIGIVLTIAIQAAINIGVVTVVLPTKGIPLPFISAGGTSLLLSSAAVGVLMNIARQGTGGQVNEVDGKIQG
ncbi:MAG: putative peptidoglycan glycosyltransferase FtsW [Planctomycetota bacterium]